MRTVTSFFGVLIGAWIVQAIHSTLALQLPGPPWNWLLTAGPVGLAASLAWWRSEHPLVRGLGSASLAIASLLSVAATCWPIAVFPVGVDAPHWLNWFGLADPLSSLPFAIAMAAVAINLAVSLGRRLRCGPDRLRFTILHLGLLTAILGGAAGHGGLIRARFVMEEGAKPGDAVTAVDGRRVRLPVALCLDDFVLDRYAPMLLVAEADGSLFRGEVLIGSGAHDLVRGLQIEVTEWLPSAAVVADRPVPFSEPGTNPAARVVIRDAGGVILGDGWLHPPGPYGSELFLALPGGRSLHLDEPRPQRYLAKIRADGVSHEITINHPLRVDGWAIYLLSYDESLGPASRTASFEAIEDRALPAVYIGLGLLILGVLMHLWKPRMAGDRV